MFQGGVGAKRDQMTFGFYPNLYWWWPVYRKRDYVRAERFWSPNYIQHSAHIASGNLPEIEPLKPRLLDLWSSDPKVNLTRQGQ